MYSIIFNPKAENQLKKLGEKVQARILNSLERIKVRPFVYDLKELQGMKYFRLRVGDYRVVLDVMQDKLVVVVIEIGHRKNIYK